MRRVLPFIGLALLLAPTLARADIDCEQLKDAEPLSSHYVAPAIQRARDGIAYAAEARANTDFFSYYLPGWAHRVAGAFAQLVDSRQSLTQRASDLTETTACLRYDQILLECAIDDVRVALDAEIERGSFAAIMRLESVLVFLQERLAHLQNGSSDDSYADPSWARQWLFDKEAPATSTEPLCPFHSDYTPPRMTGFGCDATVLETIRSRVPSGILPFVEAELDSLAVIQEEIRAFHDSLPSSLQSYKTVRILKYMPFVGPTFWTCQIEPENLPFQTAYAETFAALGYQVPVDTVFYGETPPDGWCYGFRTESHKAVAGCPREGGKGKCSLTNIDALGHFDLSCDTDDDCIRANRGFCIPPSTAKPSAVASRGVFSYPRDHLRLLVDFVQKRIDDGLSRTFPPSWSHLEDLPPESDDARLRGLDDTLVAGGRASMRIFFRSASGIQGRAEGAIFAEAQDGQLEIAAALSDMRAAIGELSRLASTKNGVRAFVAEFAYFLRRSCMFRPCQKTLEQVIRIALADACFPYTDGAFLSGSSWKACAAAACIQVDDEGGEPIELGEECEKILPDEEE